MSTNLSVCGQSGGNTGGIKCAVSPGVPQQWAAWLGSLTPSQQKSAALLKAALIGDSKKSKSASTKLFLMPAIQNKEKKKESNQEQTLSNGLKIVTREGLPGWRWSFFTSQQQLAELRKFNGLILPIVFQDDSQNTWGTIDSDANFIGRQATIYFEGLDGAGDGDVKGMAYVEVGFIDKNEAYDNQYFVKTPFSWQATLKGLIDVQLFEKAAATSIPGVSATRTITLTNLGTSSAYPTATYQVTAIGSNADTINLLIGSTSLTGGTVAKTGSETTATLLATKIKNAINAAISTNGGYTATNTGDTITITGPTTNGTLIIDTIVGGITGTDTAFSGATAGDTIAIVADGNDLTTDPVEVTPAESTLALMATKIAAAITTDTGTNGGYTATATGAVITITAPTSVGDTLNTITTGITYTGTMTGTNTAWTGGVSEGVKLHISATMDTKEAGNASDIYATFSASTLSSNTALWLPRNAAGTLITVFAVTANAAGYFDVSVKYPGYVASVAAAASGDVLGRIDLATPDVLDTALVIGIEGLPTTFVKP